MSFNADGEAIALRLGRDHQAEDSESEEGNSRIERAGHEPRRPHQPKQHPDVDERNDVAGEKLESGCRGGSRSDAGRRGGTGGPVERGT